GGFLSGPEPVFGIVDRKRGHPGRPGGFPSVQLTSGAKTDFSQPPLRANSRHCWDAIRSPSLVGRTAWRTSRLARLTLCRSWAESAVAAGASAPTAAPPPPCGIG